MRERSNYQEMQRYLDVSQFADYLILCWYMRSWDWPDYNWFAGHRVNPPSPMMFFLWDSELTWESGPDAAAWVHRRFRADKTANEPNMVGIWHSLRRSKDFMSLFADRVYRHCFNGGALTEGNATARWRLLNEFIEEAVVAESARWGDARKELGATTRTRDNTFYPEVERVAERMRGNVEQFIDVLRHEGYYPSLDPPELIYSSSLGRARMVEMRNPNPGIGTIYYTMNGDDPRSPGGGVASGALVGGDDEPISLEGSAVLKARVKIDAEWSALREQDLISF
jgi:hypothetical protein